MSNKQGTGNRVLKKVVRGSAWLTAFFLAAAALSGCGGEQASSRSQGTAAGVAEALAEGMEKEENKPVIRTPEPEEPESEQPEEGGLVCVEGVFDTYKEGELTYCTLRDAKLV